METYRPNPLEKDRAEAIKLLRAKAKSDPSRDHHCFKLDEEEAHDFCAEHICDCGALLEDFRESGGGLLIIHKDRTWN